MWYGETHADETDGMHRISTTDTVQAIAILLTQ
jgi:hypothetical protein